MYRSLEDIFNDPDFLNIVGEPLENKREQNTSVNFENLKEVEEWFKKKGRLPKPVDIDEDQYERKMYHILYGLVSDHYNEIKPFDKLGIMDKFKRENKKESEKNNSYKQYKSYKSLEDIFNDKDTNIFNDINIDQRTKKIYGSKSYSRKQSKLPESKAKRHKMYDFLRYDMMFKKVQQELSSGKRKLLPFKNYEIKLHHYYILKHQLIYIDAFGDIEEKNNKNGKYNDRRVHVIYENGTESNILYRGLGASLYGRGGKIVTEITDNITLAGDDYQTGYIYILKSLSNDPQITRIHPLYKVGFTSGSVKKRIANAENEPTYLYSPVKYILQFQVVNINAEALETAIHHALKNYRLDVDIRLSNGNIVSPREWFNVDLQTIQDVINEIVSKLQMNQ